MRRGDSAGRPRVRSPACPDWVVPSRSPPPSPASLTAVVAGPAVAPAAAATGDIGYNDGSYAPLGGSPDRHQAGEQAVVQRRLVVGRSSSARPRTATRSSSSTGRPAGGATRAPPLDARDGLARRRRCGTPAPATSTSPRTTSRTPATARPPRRSPPAPARGCTATRYANGSLHARRRLPRRHQPGQDRDARHRQGRDGHAVVDVDLRQPGLRQPHATAATTRAGARRTSCPAPARRSTATTSPR